MGHPVASIQCSVSASFRLELIEPSVREVEGQEFFFSSDTLSSLARFEPCSLLLTRPLPQSSLSIRIQKINTSLADGSINSRRKLVELYDSVTIEIFQTILYDQVPVSNVRLLHATGRCRDQNL